MPPDDQMGQDNSQPMDTSNNMIPQIMPSISSRGKKYNAYFVVFALKKKKKKTSHPLLEASFIELQFIHH